MMAKYRECFADSEALLVLGSTNARPEDRYMERSALKSVQLIDNEGVHPLSYFDSWGERGVNSLAWHWDAPLDLYVSLGADLKKFDLETSELKNYDIPRLKDVHEITLIDDTVWLSNTAFDEAVAFDVREEKVSQRISLSALQKDTARADNADMQEPGGHVGEIVDKYHCNQIFRGFDDELYTLVHHVNGKQLVKQIAQKLIKSHGNGGVIRLADGKGISLQLYGPHTVQKVKEEYWVFNSGHATVSIYDAFWKRLGEVSTKGWGRGAAFSEKANLYYAGISETRKRYLNLLPAGRGVPNMVQVFSPEDRQVVAEVTLEHMEQVNNVYLVNEEQKRALLSLTS